MKDRTRSRALRWVYLEGWNASSAGAGTELPLPDEKVSHLKKVLRLEWGEPVVLLDGHGGSARASLEKSGDRAVARVEERGEVREPETPLRLVIGLPKNATMDWIVEKAVEAGATEVIPVIATRSVVRPDPRELEKYRRRWQQIADEALEQSERRFRVAVQAPVAFEAACSRRLSAGETRFLFQSELRSDSVDGSLLSRFWDRLPTCGQAELWIGPEGGWTEDESRRILDAGAESVCLGTSVYRVETAAIVAISLVRAAWQIHRKRT